MHHALPSALGLLLALSLPGAAQAAMAGRIGIATPPAASRVHELRAPHRHPAPPPQRSKPAPAKSEPAR